jgi:exonuclease SbcC
MIPISLTVKNFLSYGDQGTTLDFKTFRVACLNGKNGHGKTALIDAISWALWGRCRVRNKDEVVRRGASEARVEFEFESEGVQYRVIRTTTLKRSGSQSTADLQIYDREADSYRPLETGAKTQGAIERILKMDYSAFICSSFILQGMADEFTKRTPAERKDVLAGILELEDYEYISKKAREEANSLTTRIQFLDAELGKLPSFDETEDEARGDMIGNRERAEIAKNSLATLTANVEGMIQEKMSLTAKLESFSAMRTQADRLAAEEAELGKKTEAARDFMSAAETILGKEAEIVKRFTRCGELVVERENLDAQYKAWVVSDSRVKEIQRKLDTLTAEYEHNLKTLQEKQKKQEALYDSLLAEEGAVCPTCQQTLNAERREMLLEQTAQGLEAITKECQEHLARKDSPDMAKLRDELAGELYALGEIGWDSTEKERLDAEYRSLSKAQEEKAILDRAQVTAEHHKKSIAEYEAQATDIRGKRTLLAAELAGVEAVTKELKEVEQKLHAARTGQDTLSKEAAEAEDKARQAERLLEDIIKSAERAQQINIEKEQFVRAQRVNVELARAYGKNGLQALIIEHVVPDIEAEANEILARLTEGTMSLSLEMLKPTQKGGEKETLEIIIADMSGIRSYETFSGGEAFRIDFALRVAISKFIANRSGAQLRTLVIDEGFGTQDKDGLDYFVQVINSVKDNFDKIIAITHVDDLKGRFPVRIEVTKDAAGSRLEVIHS